MQARRTPVRISVEADRSTLSKAQKAFNTLVEKIESRRLELEQWQAVIERYHQKVAGEMQPVAKKLVDLQLAMLKALDAAFDTKGLTKVEKKVLQDVILNMAEELVQGGDEEVKAIYNKHSPVDFDVEEQEIASNMKSAMQEMFGIDLGDDIDLNSPEDLINHFHDHVAKAHVARLEDEEQRRSRRKKTAKQVAREDALKVEAEETSLSIREVYRKLASALHPDREQDPQERVRKTGLMQRVNQAYEKKNLLQLLELQLELEHIDARAISGMSEQRLKHFNKVLKEQLFELDQEIEHYEAPLRSQFQMAGHIRIKPANVIPLLDAEIARFGIAIRKVERELSMPNDLVVFKKWIKARQREAKEFDLVMSRLDDEFPFF